MFRQQFNEDRFVAAVEKFADAFETMIRQRAHEMQPPVAIRTKSFEDIRNLIRSGDKIGAIKLFRELTGAGC